MERCFINELQKVEIGILKEFLRVCDTLNLTYYLVCGSALGAAKYSGFIPWDDDIDVALPRSDYEVFLANAQRLLPAWCFVQNYRTDPQFHLIGTKLRDSRTTYVEMMTENLDINHGVFIDVFPLDAYLDGKKNQDKFCKMQKRFEAVRRVRLKYRRFTSREVFKVRNNIYYLAFKLFKKFKDTSKYAAQYEKFISSGDLKISSIWCNHANSVSRLEYAPREQYGDGVMVPFEGLMVRIPAQYDEYLTQKYGDWRADLPATQKKGHHLYVVCDLNNSYREYVFKNDNYRK